MNLASILTESAARNPDHVSIKLDDAELSYAMLNGASAHIAGLEPGRQVRLRGMVGIGNDGRPAMVNPAYELLG